jgi:myo-inositol 2-dehydrogenase / D-chiro-inositol 1-dehydrogenase
MSEQRNLSRRSFLTSATAVTAAGLVVTGAVLNACSTEKKPVVEAKKFNDVAPDGKLIKAAVIGCGGRGTGAAINFLDAGPNLQIVAVGDLFQDKIDAFRKQLKEQKGVELADEMCFTGWDAADKVLEQDIDYVILATPPHFRPDHYSKSIAAKKHVFMEKPLAVDPVGIRSVLATTEKAKALGLSVVTGTQRRHARDYNDIYAKIKSGAIGEITGATCYWNQNKLWHRNPQADWSEMEAMIRDWVNWTWLSGDHIVEQHVHNIDVVNWFLDAHPVKAVGFGSRLRRITGDQYDNFSVDYVYENNIHVHSMCRQINGCVNNVSEYVRGSKGYTNCANTIYNTDNSVQFQYAYPVNEKGETSRANMVNDYVQEHIDLVTAIRTGEQFVEAEATAISNMTAIMGRISAYTGKEVTWDEMLNSELKYAPKQYIMGKVEIDKEIPLPGEAADASQG